VHIVTGNEGIRELLGVANVTEVLTIVYDAYDY
jgi:hypothetical protein